MNSRALAALLCTLTLGSTAFSAIRFALDGGVYSPGSLALLRYSVAALTLLVFALATRMRLPRAADLPALAANGFLGVAGYHVCLNTGEQTVEAGTANLLTSTAPILTALLARFFLKEKLRGIGWLGIGVSFCGMALIARARSNGLAFERGALFVLGAALCGSLYHVIQKPLLKKYSAPEVATYIIWLGTLPLLFYAPQLAREIAQAPLKPTLVVVYLGVLPGAFATITWGWVLARLPASRAASLLYLQPGITFVIAWLWLGEVPSPSALLGGALALSGVLIVSRWGRL
jgi:drug/metabolite transporter (DMT)-like permease